MNTNCLYVPEYDTTLSPGDIVRINRFDNKDWKVCYGWYSFGGNRPLCGWYLEDTSCLTRIKPLEYTDIPEIYLIEKH